MLDLYEPVPREYSCICMLTQVYTYAALDGRDSRYKVSYTH